MNELDGKQIAAIFWPDSESEKGRFLMVNYGVDELRLKVVYNEGTWILQIKDGVEVARHNARYVETIQWAEEPKPYPS